MVLASESIIEHAADIRAAVEKRGVAATRGYLSLATVACVVTA